MQPRFVPLMLLAAAVSAVETRPVKVLKANDGVTMSVQLDGEEQRVRLLYVDCPDATQSNDLPDAAKQALGSGGKTGIVILSSPGDTFQRDDSGAILALARDPLNCARYGDSLQAMLIYDGHCIYTNRFGDAPEPLHAQLVAAQQHAQAQKLGVWAEKKGE